MSVFSHFALSLFAFLPSLFALPAPERDALYYQERLHSEDGLKVSLHASVTEFSQFVVTYRNPENFFDFDHFPLIPESRQVRVQLSQLKRHDVIRIWGRLEERTDSQTHLFANRLEVVRTHIDDLPEFDRDFELPDEVLGLSEIIAKVHANVSDGKVLVIDYKGGIFPVIVPADMTSWSRALYRGDKIVLRYQVQSAPARPMHLVLSRTSQEPIQVLESALGFHQQPVDFIGSVVLYPKSPQISLDIFAIRVDRGDGVHLDFTLVNFEDFDLFFAILAKVQGFWDASDQSPQNGRNNLHKPELLIRVRGEGHVVDPNQANPQILIKSLEDLELIAL